MSCWQPIKLSPLRSPLTVNHLISFQLLLLHILQYVTPLLTDMWWLLIKDTWEIKLKKTGSGQSGLCNLVCKMPVFHNANYMVTNTEINISQLQAKIPQTHSQPTHGVLLGNIPPSLSPPSHLQSNEREDHFADASQLWSRAACSPYASKIPSTQGNTPRTWCNCSFCALHLYLKQSANLHSFSSDDSRTCQRAYKLLGAMKFITYINLGCCSQASTWTAV